MPLKIGRFEPIQGPTQRPAPPRRHTATPPREATAAPHTKDDSATKTDTAPSSAAARKVARLAGTSAPRAGPWLTRSRLPREGLHRVPASCRVRSWT